MIWPHIFAFRGVGQRSLPFLNGRRGSWLKRPGQHFLRDFLCDESVFVPGNHAWKLRPAADDYHPEGSNNKLVR